jgi:dimethylhistidine N-methyltransferase
MWIAMTAATTSAVQFTMQADPLAEEILAGLRGEPRHIAPKYFYDQNGAALFDAITRLDEYYVTRLEAEIYSKHRSAICTAIGSDMHFVEPGAGSCEKIRWLLPELQPRLYTPMDISAAHLQASVARLRADFPDLNVTAQVCDHTAGLWLGVNQPDAPRVFFYPGSSIGNFEPEAAVGFMRVLRSTMDERGGLLIGVDSKKNVDVLHAAYNDRTGVTAQFNLNVLMHLNKLLGGNLAADNFVHVAHYDETFGRIQMYLQCRRSHSAVLAGERLEFVAGEQIHTENSYKYYPDEFVTLAGRAGFVLKELWQDDKAWFSVMYFSAD